MPEHITKDNAERAFEGLCKALGKRVISSSDYADKEGWFLDWYGGFCRVEMHNGETPFGMTRLSPREFYYAAKMATNGIEIYDKRNR